MDDETALSLSLDEQGQICACLKARHASELRALQQSSSSTVLVLPAEHCSLHQVTLPPLKARSRQQAIAYALEDELAQPIEELQFLTFQDEPSEQWHKRIRRWWASLPSLKSALHKKHRFSYQAWPRLLSWLRHRWLLLMQYCRSQLALATKNNRPHVIAVIDKAILNQLMHTAAQLDVRADMVMLDWSALHEEESCVTDSCFLVNTSAFIGVLGLEAMTKYEQQYPNAVKPISFKSRALFYEWLAPRLLKAPRLSLSPRDFCAEEGADKSRFWLLASVGVCVVWALSICLINAVQWTTLSYKERHINQAISAMYHHLFPESTQVVQPRIRTQQLFHAEVLGRQNVAWQLLGRFSQAVKETKVTVNALQFQHQRLRATVIVNNQASLQQCQKRLREAKLTVTKTSGQSDSLGEVTWDIGLLS